MAADVTPIRGWIARHAAHQVNDALQDTPVVAINGARQVGKSTLVAHLLSGRFEVVSLDDATQRAAAERDPHAFVHERAGPLVIDEVQRVPDLLLAIKASVDHNRRPGQFVLTGSTRLLSTPRLSESLAGRIEIIDLWPLSQGELAGRREQFVDAVFARDFGVRIESELSRQDYFDIVVAGGFPDARLRTGRRRDIWFENYATTVVERVVADVADIDRLHLMPALLRLCAARTANELNVASIANDLGIPYRTVGSYLAHLQTVFLTQHVPAWSRNLTRKVIRRPKIVIVDSGLAAHLLAVDAAALARPDSPAGQLLETFVTMELRKQLGWSETRANLNHFRDRDGTEVDIVLEARNGDVVAIEVKAASTATSSDFRALRLLQAKLGPRFVAGLVLYTGPQSVPFGRDLAALPIAALWRS